MNGAIILAAGQGTRYHGKKQDLIFHDKPIWRYVYDTIASIIDHNNIVVVGKDVEGGTTRTGSVRNGLSALSGKRIDRVVVAEAARPMVTKEQIMLLLKDSSPSSTFVRPLVNTPIYRNGKYVDRNEMYDLLTPQAFDMKMLSEAYGSGRFEDTTDETRIVYEYFGIKPHFIETAESNLFKITYPGDLEVIESIYKSQINKNE
jgi:2-C-methyl-D-erythritol 4-phosphate cytidylyltransferase